MKTYTKYKETNIPWITHIPQHWEVVRGKQLYKKESRLPVIGDDVVTCFRDGQVTLRKNRRTVGFTESLKEIGYQRVLKGDLVIHVMDAFAGSIGVSDSSGKCTPVYSVCTAKLNSNNHYFACLVRQMAQTGYIQSLYKGIRERSSDFRFEVFGQQYVPVPPLAEQEQIVRFLDWKVSQINKLINAKKQQITLLNEQKQATINQAVTKGINPKAKLKQSKIPWIGQIPEHWQRHQLAKTARIILSGLDKKSYPGQQSVSLCNYLDVYRNDNITANLPFMRATASDAEMGNLRLHMHDVIITKDSETWDDIGVPAVVVDNVDNLFCGYHLCILRSHTKRLMGRYLHKLFCSQYVQIQLKVKAKGVTRFALGYQAIHDTYLFLPPLDEQREIVDFIDANNEIYCTLIDQHKAEIALLTECRTSLISSVVTGQYDVRDIPIPDYDTTDEEPASNPNDDTEEIDDGTTDNPEEDE